MTTDELKELLDYIQENNSWEHMYECHKRDRYAYKYVRISYDTRDTNDGQDPHVWNIVLENGGMAIEFRESSLVEIKAFLDLPMKKAAKQLKDSK